jgi:flagellin-like protein
LAKSNTLRRRKTMKIKNLRKCRKAVSPVISVLLMIAVAVAASLITYAWVMGYLGSTTGKVGKAIQIQSMAITATDGTANFTIYVQNVGDGAITLDSLYVNGILRTFTNDTSLTLPKTQTVALSTALPSPFKPSDTVTVKVVNTDGTFIEASQTIQGAE